MDLSDDFRAGMSAQKKAMVRKGWRPPPEGDSDEPGTCAWTVYIYGVLTGLIVGAVVGYYYGSQLIELMSK